MSTLKADTLVASDGTSPVTLTKLQASTSCVACDSSANLENTLNVSSSTDNSTGDFTFTLTNANSANTKESAYGASGGGTSCYVRGRSGSWTTSSIRIGIHNSSGTNVDAEYHAVLAGDLA